MNNSSPVSPRVPPGAQTQSQRNVDTLKLPLKTLVYYKTHAAFATCRAQPGPCLLARRTRCGRAGSVGRAQSRLAPLLDVSARIMTSMIVRWARRRTPEITKLKDDPFPTAHSHDNRVRSQPAPAHLSLSITVASGGRLRRLSRLSAVSYGYLCSGPLPRAAAHRFGLARISFIIKLFPEQDPKELDHRRRHYPWEFPRRASVWRRLSPPVLAGGRVGGEDVGSALELFRV
jgi:hypothetical protein